MSEWKITTPIDTFAHPETGSQIDLVSVVHVGLPSYYQKLGSYIMDRQDQGFAVHHEGIAVSDEGKGIVSPLGRIKRRIMLAEMDQEDKGYASVILHSSYTFQDNTELFHEAGSERHDLTEADVAQRTGIFTHIRAYGSSRRFSSKLEKAANKGPEEMDEFVFGVIKAGVDKAKSGTERNKQRRKVTINMRNQVALEGVDAALQDDPDARLVLVWGIGHLAGLQSGLLDRGYEHIGRQETDLAVNHTQLKRDLRKSEEALRRQQAKVDRMTAPNAGHPFRRTKPEPNKGSRTLLTDFAPESSTLAQLNKDQLRRQRETQKRLAESKRRSSEMMRKFGEDRKRREGNLFGHAIPSEKKRRFLPWLSAK